MSGALGVPVTQPWDGSSGSSLRAFHPGVKSLPSSTFRSSDLADGTSLSFHVDPPSTRAVKHLEGPVVRMPEKTIALVNATGRQAASLARVASAVGYRVKAQLRSREGLVAQELEGLPNVELIEGSLEDRSLVEKLLEGAQLAFVNTTYWDQEVAIGRALADAAKKARVQHYVYSSMPDHSIYGQGWPALPLWSAKFTVENYIRQIGIPATFVYAGIYNNNFTSLPYPLFCMELQSDGSFQWTAPFHPDVPLPWLDAEHDVGPAVLQIFKDGPGRWSGQR